MATLHEYTSVVAMAFKKAFMQCAVHILQNSTDIADSTDVASLIEDFIKDSDVGDIVDLFNNRINQYVTDRNESEIHPYEVSKTTSTIVNEVLHIKSDWRSDFQTVGTKCQMSSFDEPRQVICDRTIASGVIYDSFVSKMAAWQGAWELVKTVLQADFVLVSGIDKINSLL